MRRLRLIFSPAIGTDSFQPKLTVLYEETGRDVYYIRNHSVVKAVRPAAFSTGKMRMTLIGPAVMSQFKIADPILNIRLVDQILFDHDHDGPVDGCLVRCAAADLFGDLLLGQGAFRLEQGLYHGQARPSFPQTARLQQSSGFFKNLVIHNVDNFLP